ncbi:MAG: phytanoyl-CoA dioxygenase family protein [Candidatus Poribacteria bacterium]|nr:phytanoyl-CoA dioxygenase family protein [Candidatus Poribacteria bacterium]
MLTPDQLDHFQENGYVILDPVVSPTEFEALRQRCDDITQGRIQHEGMWFQKDIGGSEYKLGPGGKFDGPSDNYRKIEGWENDPLFLQYMQHPVFRGITKQMMGEQVRVYRAMFMNKPPKLGTVLPYHQDGGTGWRLSSVDGNDFLTVWNALDAATIENGCVEVVPGSHKLGLLSERGHTISKEHEEAYAKTSVFLELEIGQVAVLHNFLLHRSDINKTDRSRRGFSVCYIDGKVHRLDAPDHPGFPIIFGPGALTVEDAQARMTA